MFHAPHRRWADRSLAVTLATCLILVIGTIAGASAYTVSPRASASKRAGRHDASSAARRLTARSSKFAATRAPRLTVSGTTLSWTRIDDLTRYVLLRRAAGEANQYRIVTGTSATPESAPGQTVHYSVRTDVLGSKWAAGQAISYPANPPVHRSRPDETAETVSPPAVKSPVTIPPVTIPPVTAPPVTIPPLPTPPAPTPPAPTPPVLAPAAPVLSLHGDTISWAPVAGARSYTLAIILHPDTTRITTYTTVTSTSVTPPVVPGQTVNYGLAAQAIVGGPWAQEVTISYPATQTSESKETSSTSSPTFPHKIIGTNDGAGWGPAAAQTILAGHIAWNRVEIGGPYNPISASEQEGFHNLAIVGNTDDGTPLSQIEPNSWANTVVAQIQANPGISIAEAGNEMYLKGGTFNPVQYGHMYLAAVNAMKAAGIHIPLLFNMYGDYERANGTWSVDTQGGGWLREAVSGVPGLGSAILANGVSSHPYGGLGANSADSYGVEAIPAQESVEQAVLGATPAIYITEYGFDLARCGSSDGACSQQEQASKLKATLKVFLADPHIAGIWCYQSHDDGTGQWGYMNSDNSPRPAFEVLSQFAIEQGQ